MIKHASAKSKGTRLEKKVVEDLSALGLKVRRQPGSGVYRDFPSDVAVEIRGKAYLCECKARATGFSVLDRWLGKAEILVVRVDRQKPRVYLEWETFKELIGGE